MSDEISRRLTEAAAAHGAEAESLADVAHIAASIIGPARRRRRITGVATVAAAFGALAVFAGGSLAVVDAFGSKDANPATLLSPPSLGGPVTPEPSLATKAVTGAADAGDGIDVYPPLVPLRGMGFPVAYEMRAWVWDHVGAGWSLQSYSQNPDPYAKRPTAVPEAIIYLVSPQGAAFEVQAVPVEYSAGLRVVSWQEDDRTAHIEWGDLNGVTSTGGGELDLNMGTVAPIVFTTPWGVSSTVAPVAVTATGNELWAAWLGTHVRYYRFGTADGWTVATVNGLLASDDAAFEGRWAIASQDGAFGVSTRGDGRAVLFEHRVSSGAQASGAPMQVAVYDVDADVYVTSDVNEDFGARRHGRCTVTGWFGGDELGYTCAGEADSTIIKLRDVPDSGATSSFRMGSTDEAPDTGPHLSGYVGFGDPPPHDALFPR